MRRELAKGRTGEEALTYRGPHGKPSTPLTAWGETKTVSEWLKDSRCKAAKEQIHNRVHFGIKPEDSISHGSGYKMVNDRGTKFLKRMARIDTERFTRSAV